MGARPVSDADRARSRDSVESGEPHSDASDHGKPLKGNLLRNMI